VSGDRTPKTQEEKICLLLEFCERRILLGNSCVGWRSCQKNKTRLLSKIIIKLLSNCRYLILGEVKSSERFPLAIIA